MAIDYALARSERPKLKAALTRAINSGNPQKVIDACEHAFERFDAWGAWPDDWSRWNIAREDAIFNQRFDRWSDQR